MSLIKSLVNSSNSIISSLSGSNLQLNKLWSNWNNSLHVPDNFIIALF